MMIHMMKYFYFYVCTTVIHGFHTHKILTSKQQKYKTLLEDNNLNLVIAQGPAGTGKSYLACKIAISLLKQKRIHKIVLTRPIVPVENEDLGFLPGTLNEKMNPWIQPLYDIFIDEESKAELGSLLSSNKIEIVPIGYMRGRTFADTYVIADEMQNSSPSQMKMLLTRMGENSKIVITGDTSQCDLSTTQNGLQHFLTLMNNYYHTSHDMYNNKIGMVELNNQDVKRSEFVKHILSIYQEPSYNGLFLP